MPAKEYNLAMVGVLVPVTSVSGRRPLSTFFRNIPDACVASWPEHRFRYLRNQNRFRVLSRLSHNFCWVRQGKQSNQMESEMKDASGDQSIESWKPRRTTKACDVCYNKKVSGFRS